MAGCLGSYPETHIGTIHSMTRKRFRELAPLLRFTVIALLFGPVLAPVLLRAQTYTDLHDFDCTVEGCFPLYPEVLAQGRDGNLYGATDGGGTSSKGTIFKITPSGAFTTIHNFSGPDGQNPDSGLVLGTDGNFYGTTRFGGANNFGTVYRITSSGVLTTLHSFIGSDGSEPWGGLVQGKNGTFYGLTCGFNAPWTAYSITSSGTFKTINGATPPCSVAPLRLGSDGNLYGTSSSGGTTGQGTVFRLTPAGAIKVLYNFDGTHGSTIRSPVVQGNDGFLYGTAEAGGTGQGGVVFKLSTTGRITLLHQFDSTSTTDGSSPVAGLAAASDSKFYGGTMGGSSIGSVPDGNLFSVTTSAVYDLLFAFDTPHGRLLQATPMQHTNGKIYGVTEAGGSHDSGVVYSLDNGAPPFVLLMTRWGTAGQTVQILGTGLTGTTAVNFGSGAASFTVVSDTYMTATVPASGATGFVTVTTPTGTLTSSQKFNVVPVVTSFLPASGPVGTQVSITGTGLSGATQVTFGGVKATSFTVNSGTSITATAPTGAVTGKIAVKTAGGSASSKTVFTVN